MLIHLVMSLQCDVTAKKARTILRHNWGNIVSWERIAIVPFCRPSRRWLLEYSVQFLNTSKPERSRSREGIQQEWLKKLKKARAEHSCSPAWSYPINPFTLFVLLITAEACSLVTGYTPTVMDTDCQCGWIFFFFFFGIDLYSHTLMMPRKIHCIQVGWKVDED